MLPTITLSDFSNCKRLQPTVVRTAMISVIVMPWSSREFQDTGRKAILDRL